MFEIQSIISYMLIKKQVDDEKISSNNLQNYSLIAGNKSFSTITPMLYVTEAIKLVNEVRSEMRVIEENLKTANEEKIRFNNELIAIKEIIMNNIDGIRKVVHESKKTDLKEIFEKMFPIEVVKKN